MKVLAVGDSYVPIEVFRAALERVPEAELDLAEADADVAGAPPEPGVREYAGSAAHVAGLLDGHDVLVVHGAPITAAVLDASSALRLVCCARGGPVNVDVRAATERGIPVVTTPGKNAEAVADLTLAFLVMLARGLPRAVAFLKDGGQVGQSAFEGAEFFGHDLGGLRLGLFGFGHVGRRVADRAGAFGMEVLVHDPYVAEPSANGAAWLGFEELLAQADVVSLHVRATRESENMIDARALATMRPGSFLVNTARETLVDEAALAAALADGHLAGAALDVVRPVPEGERNSLLDLEQVIVTPHIGGATDETLARGAEMIAEELRRWAAGGDPENVADPAALGERERP